MQSDTSAPSAPSETVDILVKKATNIPKRIIERMRIRRGLPVFVPIAYGNATKRTRISIPDKGTIKWDEELIGITLTQSTPLKFEIYSQKSKSDQTLIGQRDIPAERLRSLSGQDHTLDINYTGRLFSSRKTIQLDLFISSHKSQSSTDTTDARISGALGGVESSSDPGKSQAALAGDVAGPVPLTSQSVEEAVGKMGPTPRLASVVVDGTQIATDAVCTIIDQYGSWETLLERVKFVVDKIAQIHPYASMAFEKASSVRIIRMDDEKLGAETEDDILQYTHTHLAKYLSDSDCDRIAHIAGRLFQWASVACKFIIDPPRGKLRSECVSLLMNSKTHEPQKRLDELYHSVLRSIFSDISQDGEALARYKTVMGLILAPFEPLSQDALVSLARFAPRDSQVGEEGIQTVIDSMGSLLSNVTTALSASPVVPLHTSFRDFLTSEDRSGSFFVDLSVPHNALARSSLRLMLDPAEGVRFNICRIPTSYLQNSDIPDLKSRIEEHLPPILSYACRYWDDHLKQVTFSEDIFLLIQELFKEKLLFWFEALSLTGSVSLATSALSSLQRWLSQASDCSSEDLSVLNVLVEDSISFVRAFEDVIAYHAAHIYLSALSFCPLPSAIYETYRNLFEHSLKVIRGQSHHWGDARHGTIEQAAESLEEYPFPIAFSSDGKAIAFRSNSGVDVQLLQDGTVDRALSKTLVGHSDKVQCAAFSPDGSRLATGSADCMPVVRVWDVATSNDLFGPLKGHQAPVSEVIFSSDGTLIATADGRSIRSWNVLTGAPVGPLTAVVPETPQSWPSPLAYSPDNQCIAFASDNKTIQVWEVNTGRATLEPLQGHTRLIFSIAFSLNGNRIASGGADKTVRIWDAKTGKPATKPCTGHTSCVGAVAFSPDSSRVVSGSSDGTVRVWDAATGEPIAGPFGGHTSSVEFVAFSPSGDHIISGSGDGVVRTTRLIVKAQPSHVQILNTCALSGDGWMRGPNEELMFWVPEHLRKGLFRPSTVNAWGAGVEAIEVDYSSFVHGERWAECHTAGTDG